MPPTPAHKTIEIPKKPSFDQVSRIESGKVESSEVDLISVDSSSRSAGGADETPVKRVARKSTKLEDDKTGRKLNSAIVDKVPKKNAQRAKGSISLNKTIEKTSAELTEKKRPAFDSNVSISTAKEGGNVGSIKSGTDGRRTPVSVRNKGSKTKATAKKPVKKDSKSSKSKTQKPWADAVEKISSNALEKTVTEETITKDELVEVQKSENRPLNPPFATCTFFEKLQQGVKSYFSSKNSFSSYDKNNKEGGNQNRASVANGVKEDAKKRGAGLILKNDIYNSESDLSHDELRSDSNLGGRLNNFSNNRPKFFRKLKRKKLYHPKKHYVRIQIPRKGYFYRSTIQFKAPGSPTSGQFERLESHDVPKNESKIQISGLASTSSKISNFPNKKKLKAKEGNSEEEGNDDGFSSKYLDRINPTLNDGKLSRDFEEKINDYLALFWPYGNEHSREKKKLQLKNDQIFEFVNPELEEGKQMSAISDYLFSSDTQKVMDRKEKKSCSMGDDFSDILDKENEKVLPSCKKQKKTSETTFKTLINCINSTLGNDKLIYDLEITPVNTTKNPDSLQGFTEKPFQFTEIIRAFNNFDYSYDNSVKSEIFHLSSVPPTNFCHTDDKKTAYLMEEVDLHLELQNYLKGYDNISTSKTKSTQESNFSSSIGLLNKESKLPEIRKSRSGSSFASASSICSTEDKNVNQFRVFLDCKRRMMSVSEECLSVRSPKTFSLQNEFMNDSDEIRKIKSENNPRVFPQDSKLNSSIKRTFGKTSFHMFLLDDKENLIPRYVSSLSKGLSTEDSIDSYEKIIPFDTNSNNSCHDTRTRNKSCVLFENRVHSLSAESMPQRVWKIASDSNQFEIKSSENVKMIEPIRSTVQKESSSSETILSPDSQRAINTPKWSPTLQDLIDIYNSVLKQNRKIRRSSKNSVNNCFSSHLFTFLNEKLKEKQFKANLMKLSKDFSNNYKPSKPWKSLNKKENSVDLKEYVAMFQEILQSSLSISQITRLNNIISGLQGYSEKHYNFFKDLRSPADEETGTKKTEEIENLSTKEEINYQQPKLVSFSKSKAQSPKENRNVTKEPTEPSSALPQIGRRKTKKLKSEKMNAQSKEKIHEIELSSPTELEHLLRTSFDPAQILCDDPEEMNTKSKILVTVKLSGNRILVSGLSYFNDEDSLSSQRIKPGGTSELIIESVTKDQIRDVCCEDTKINALEEPKQSHTKETSKKPDLKLKKFKISKVRKSQVKTKEIKSNSKMENSYETEYLEQQNRPSEVTFPFEYDQMQLRAQHPIEAIIESSESKISEILENSNNDKSKTTSELSSMTKILLKDIRNESTIKKALKEVLEENIFSKDLICNFDLSEEEMGKTLGRTKSYVIRRRTSKRRDTPFTKKKQFAETVKSMVDLNSKKTYKKRKGRKAPPVRLRNSYYCYPTVSSFKEENIRSNQKPREKFKDKKLACASSKTATGSTIQIEELKSSQDFGFKQNRQKSEVTTNKSEIPDSKATHEHRQEEEIVNQSSSNAVLYLNSEMIPDCCSIELLLPENTQNPFTFSVPGFLEKQNLETLSGQSSYKVQKEAPNCSQTFEIALDKVSDSPIVLHSARSDLDDLSFPTIIIHSDSFLKCFSQLDMARGKLEPLFKSNSDMKFYSQRISKDGSEPKPFVTFVLTPKQKETAGVSSDKIKLVTKMNPAEFSADGDQNEKQAPEISKSSGKMSLESVEKFIKELSKCRKTVMIPKQLRENCKKEKKKLAQSSSSFGPKKKTFVPGQTPITSDPVHRKAYHECQKRKKESARIGIKIKKVGKMPDKTEESQLKKIKSAEKQEKMEKSHFPNKIKDFIRVLEIFGNEEKIKETGKCGEKKGDINSKVADFNEKPCKTVTDDVNENEIAQSEVIDVNSAEAEGKTNKNSTKISSNFSSFISELLETLKTALAQAKDFKNKTEIMSIVEEELNKKYSKLLEETATPCKSLGDSLAMPKKLKKLKIKIHCSGQKCLTENKKMKNPGQNSETEKTSPLEEVKSAKVCPSAQTTGEVDILNSFVLGEAVGGDLERKNSTYFDALEKTLPEEIRGSGEEMGDIQKTHQRPREGILDLNAEFGVKEEKPRFHPLLTLSDEKLLSKDCLTKECEEAVVVKISKSLKEDKISYSMALLDEFLNKVENSSNCKDTCFRLRRILFLVENKSRNLMMSMEKNAWLKVLSLLEEICQTFESEDIEGLMRGHLQVTKAFIDKIHALNISRLVDLQNFYHTLSQHPAVESSANRIGNIFHKICESLNFLQQKFSLKRSCTYREIEKFRQYENQGNESRFKMHSTISLPDIREKVSQCKEKNQLEYLKRKIQQQKTCIEQLMKPENDSVPREIEDVRNKVAEKMKWLEKMFEFYSLEESSKGLADWDKTTSLMETAKNCRKSDMRGDKNVPNEVDLDRSPGYADLMQNLIKVWDTRMFLNSYSNDCFR